MSNRGAEHMRRVVLLGTPNLGTVKAFRTLKEGSKVGLNRIPREVVASLLAGMVLTAGLFLIVVLRLSGSPALGGTTADRLQRLTPFIMIAIGLYILADTGTDLQ